MAKHSILTGLGIAVAALTLAALGAWAQGPGGPGGGPMKNLDTDGDGKISFAEAQAGNADLTQDMFNQMDVDGDGYITEEDRPGAELRPTSEQLDPDEDGTVTLAEYKAAWNTVLEKKFDRLDTDDDGALSKEELAKDQRPQGPPGMGGRGMRGGPMR